MKLHGLFLQQNCLGEIRELGPDIENAITLRVREDHERLSDAEEIMVNIDQYDVLVWIHSVTVHVHLKR